MNDYHTHAMHHIEAVGAVWSDITDNFMALMAFGPDIYRPMMGGVYEGEPLLIVSHALNLDTGYLAAMHEVGHLASGHLEVVARLQGPWNPEFRRTIVGLEAEAWRWAFANALPVSDRAVELAVQAFQTYLNDFGWGSFSPADLPDVMATHFTRKAVAA